MTAIKATVFSLLLSSASGAAIHQRQGMPAQNPWPATYVALGDSYASGVGAGKFFSDNADDRQCGRFSGSYPNQVAELIPSISLDKAVSFDFVACGGDELPDLVNQTSTSDSHFKNADVVTLSIGGNDFGFSDAINACIYNGRGDDPMKDAQCAMALKASQVIVNGTEVWDKFKQEVTKIVDENLNDLKESFLIITGYMKFFAKNDDDSVCGWRRFPLQGPQPGVTVVTNILHKSTRDTMNSLVDQVNSKTKEMVASLNSNKVEFFDIDPAFEGHRFCEPTQQIPVPAALGDPDNDDVWIFSFVSKLEESPSSINGTLPPDQIQVRSVFHPKPAGHTQTALAIANLIQTRQSKFL
ncbi:hypothetical protein HYFRA_00011058 [Hymenoscyphus fraxineus]|uniref:SGNH hydrolase-type esterase domain-containing protein n=1 Tax=Hymenoscyphus fraxineus TaxID=746836 RepID=A0A9N9L4E7_9HELO|nr:hypothetical protein HYFRA_00011058 [Hymenoscyphus fraxineus]